MSTKRVAERLFPLLVKVDERLAKSRGPVSPTDRAIWYAAAMGDTLGAADATLLAGHLVATRTGPLTLEWCENAIAEWAKAKGR
jgi:hypothetical protein